MIYYGKGVEMKTFKNITASDFPGVDAKNFAEWKQAVMQTRGTVYVLLILYLVLNIKSYGTTGYIIYDTPIVMLIGFLLISEHTRYAPDKLRLYMIIALCFLIVFNIALLSATGRFTGESLIAIVVLFWLFNKSQKNNRSAIERGITDTALKRALSQ